MEMKEEEKKEKEEKKEQDVKNENGGNRAPETRLSRRPGPQISHVDAKGKVVPTDKVKKPKKQKKPWTFKRVMLRIVLPIFLVLAIIAGGSVVSMSDYTSETYNPPVEEEHIHNFLLIGIDSRSRTYTDDGSGSLADVIMVMSVDDKEGTIKLVTIQRDCYAFFPGYKKPQKINAAMTYGGPELLSKVVENHLRIILDGYAFVNFYNMEKVIDAVGGIDIEVTKSEVYHEPGGLNANLREQNKIAGDPESTYALNEYGMVHLNGRQAVAYSRIREVGNGVYGRSERQVKVLNQLLKKFTDLGTTSKLSALDDILRMIATNISKEEIEDYVFDFLPKVRDMELQTMGIPVEGYYRQGMYSDVRANEWSIRPDWNGMVPLVQEFFYGETYPFDEVPEIPKAPKHDSDS